MRVTIQLFARLRDIAGAGTLVREAGPGSTVESVWKALAGECPGLAPYRSSLSCAVNAEYARFHTTLADGDEVAFLPPVSGG